MERRSPRSDFLDARAALDALDALVLIWRDELLKCLREGRKPKELARKEARRAWYGQSD